MDRVPLLVYLVVSWAMGLVLEHWLRLPLGVLGVMAGASAALLIAGRQGRWVRWGVACILMLLLGAMRLSHLPHI